MNDQPMHWIKKRECRVFKRSGAHTAFVSCVTTGKSLNLSEFGSHPPTPVDYCADQQERGLRVFQGQGQSWVQARCRGEEGSDTGGMSGVPWGSPLSAPVEGVQSGRSPCLPPADVVLL